MGLVLLGITFRAYAVIFYRATLERNQSAWYNIYAVTVFLTVAVLEVVSALPRLFTASFHFLRSPWIRSIPCRITSDFVTLRDSLHSLSFSSVCESILILKEMSLGLSVGRPIFLADKSSPHFCIAKSILHYGYTNVKRFFWNFLNVFSKYIFCSKCVKRISWKNQLKRCELAKNVSDVFGLPL